MSSLRVGHDTFMGCSDIVISPSDSHINSSEVREILFYLTNDAHVELPLQAQELNIPHQHYYVPGRSFRPPEPLGTGRILAGSE